MGVKSDFLEGAGHWQVSYEKLSSTVISLYLLNRVIHKWYIKDELIIKNIFINKGAFRYSAVCPHTYCTWFMGCKCRRGLPPVPKLHSQERDPRSSSIHSLDSKVRLKWLRGLNLQLQMLLHYMHVVSVLYSLWSCGFLLTSRHLSSKEAQFHEIGHCLAGVVVSFPCQLG